ncbi:MULTISPECIES: Lrp/AsnC family transcriptional regulator [Acinetobacter calcoaceticus/baumannii complex]|uniref:Lrp/AsnC family transcriptional regulator n=1 Tax=Acinetobacter calcoaceticus/baumannii complex TaxID=909768 RepID=UPI0002C04019|nr:MULTISPECIES: Lrp/AsnC family transcriptional regulator [Acinetobacter calcoaceticus/baumannii complex]AGH34429.1 transcriptional regulator, AsnC family [Acinetobacter baumannii D1279779]AUM27053.1 AsnC family transcriptional regulator [Acinetobacter pittii]AXX52299.1 Lrp/AsnC family transcriptional regulator [Acinetobacter baumannii]EKT9844670.1 Lrp/AsnC family transcriptional regulator [Acinetobacter baumannii]EKT9848505.1 Lrp/AsnC family transcriptional regulator [Acinetobacter baumannii
MYSTDLKILNLLRENARMSITDIANLLHVSRATVQKRIEQMENSGLITGYTVKIKPNFESNYIRAWMNIMIEGTKMQNIIKELRLQPVIKSLHTTNGKWDLLVELQAKDLEEFDQALGHIRTIQGVYNTETSILLSTYKT